MGVKLFVSILLVLGIAAYFIPVENKIRTNTNKDTPLVSFENPYMYTLTENNIEKIVIATKAIKYKNRDEMYNADVIIKNIKKDKKFDLEKLKAKYVVSRGDIITLKEDVVYKRDNFMVLNTQELFYNTKEKIAHNTVFYDGIYNNNYIEGTNLYLNSIEDYIKSEDVHFEIDMKNKK